MRRPYVEIELSPVLTFAGIRSTGRYSLPPRFTGTGVPFWTTQHYNAPGIKRQAVSCTVCEEYREGP